MKKPILIANWKMYIEKPEKAKAFVASLRRKPKLLSNSDVVLVPPFTLLSTVAGALATTNTLRLGAQTVSPFTEAKHTGDISTKLLQALKVGSVIVGHSERREGGENDNTVAAQVVAALAAKMEVVLCVGEKERDAAGSHFSFVEEQLRTALKGYKGGKLVVAYEPVWAIGKQAADAMKPHELEEMVIFIRKTLTECMERPQALKVPILYGGSVEPTNAKELLVGGAVAGFLVGHASTEVESFIGIIEATQK